MCIRADHRAAYYFNPRSPQGGATHKRDYIAGQARGFQSTLPARGSDENVPGLLSSENDFNPRSPQGGATLQSKKLISVFAKFQSTLPARGSDFNFCPVRTHYCEFQSTLPARGSDPRNLVYSRYHIGISIHAPRKGERRTSAHGASAHNSNFNPRSPQGGATFIGVYLVKLLEISIHAPRKGERPQSVLFVNNFLHFNPRSPQGGATRLKF